MEQKENMAPSSGLDDDLPPSGPPADSLRLLKKKYSQLAREISRRSWSRSDRWMRQYEFMHAFVYYYLYLCW